MTQRKDYKRWYYYNVLKPQKKAFNKWLREADPREIWQYFDIDI